MKIKEAEFLVYYRSSYQFFSFHPWRIKLDVFHIHIFLLDLFLSPEISFCFKGEVFEIFAIFLSFRKPVLTFLYGLLLSFTE